MQRPPLVFLAGSLLVCALLSCSSPPSGDEDLEEALAIREQVCGCAEAACFEERTAALWVPFSARLQSWWNEAAAPDREAMEAVVRDIGGLCRARAEFSVAR